MNRNWWMGFGRIGVMQNTCRASPKRPARTWESGEHTVDAEKQSRRVHGGLGAEIARKSVAGLAGPNVARFAKSLRLDQLGLRPVSSIEFRFRPAASEVANSLWRDGVWRSSGGSESPSPERYSSCRHLGVGVSGAGSILAAGRLFLDERAFDHVIAALADAR